jgi:rhodanese-related sulfurtransferase
MRGVFVLLFISALSATTLTGCQTAPTKKTDSPAVVMQTGVSEIPPQQARPAVDAAYAQFIDVRSPEEFKSGHAARARNIPIDELMVNLDKLEKNERVYLICQSGNRSKKAAQMLVDAGFPQAISIAGGTNAWKEAGFPIVQ